MYTKLMYSRVFSLIQNKINNNGRFFKLTKSILLFIETNKMDKNMSIDNRLLLHNYTIIASSTMTMNHA